MLLTLQQLLNGFATIGNPFEKDTDHQETSERERTNCIFNHLTKEKA